MITTKVCMTPGDTAGDSAANGLMANIKTLLLPILEAGRQKAV